MDKGMLLNWLLQDAEKHGNNYCNHTIELEGVLYELNNRREITLPRALPKKAEAMIPVLRDHFGDNVTFISLVLNHYFPENHIFYRVSKLEDEIFAGFDFFSEIIAEFSFSFFRVGRTGFERYLALNEALLEFAHDSWPKLGNPQGRLAYFLYQGLGRLFLAKSDYNRYWVMATKEEYWCDLDEGKDIEWSGRKEMQPGDLVFMYRLSPRKAITDIYQVKAEPRFDPWGAWHGFWVDLKKVCQIDDISFAEMYNDSFLYTQWGTIRKQFTGTIVDPVPHSVYNWLLEKIPRVVRSRCRLNPAPVRVEGSLGEFETEKDFEDEVVVPRLKRWNLKYERQHPCLFRIGSQYHRCRVDFYVSDERGPLTLFEDKLQVLNDKDLKPTVDQAKSYALMLGLPSFVVASPEGMWLYSLNGNEETLVKHFSVDKVKDQDGDIRRLILELRQ